MERPTSLLKIAILILLACQALTAQIITSSQGFVADENCLIPASSGELSASATFSEPCEDDFIRWEVLVDINNDWSYEHIFSTEAPPLDSNFGTPENEYYIPPTTLDQWIAISIPEAFSGARYAHRVVWKASNGCEDAYVHTTELLTEDHRAPVLICNEEMMTFELPFSSHNATIIASDFVLDASDNCTSSEDLRYTFTSFPPEEDDDYREDLRTSVIDIPLDDITHRPVDVTIYVWDQAGNMTSCATSVNFIIEGLIVCDFPQPIEGSMRSVCGIPLHNFTIEIMSNHHFELSVPIKVSEDGTFSSCCFETLPKHRARIHPLYAANHGVDNDDLILMQAYIDGVIDLDPYTRIAADINQDGSIDASDLQSLESILNGGDWPTYAWQFTTDGAGLHALNSDYEVTFGNGNWSPLDIIAIKLGDLNCSITQGSRGSISSPTSRLSIDAVFPNPFESELHIPIRLLNADIVHLRVYDMIGKVLHAKKTPHSSGYNLLTLDANLISRLPSGSYIVHITAGGSSHAVRVVKAGM